MWQARARGATPLKRIGILHHPKLPETPALALQMARQAQARGLEAWLGSTWDEQRVSQQVGELDLLVTLGGDGSILRAARMAAQHGVPILGVNLGRLGFLAELEPGEWEHHLGRLLAGEYWLEKRMMLHAEYWQEDPNSGSCQVGCKGVYEALNDVVVSRGSLARIVRVEAFLDGGFLTRYMADGLIVSTPTGSTAYALAVGGPILPPELRNILLIPIAPHLSMGRAIVLSEGVEVKMQVRTDHQAILTVDGQFEYELQDGEWVVVKASPHVSQFVRFEERTYFYRNLIERLRGL
jgi:NAD+ kinase